MLAKKTIRTLIVLSIVLLPFSFVEGSDALFCVSLKEFHKGNKIFHRIRGLDFHVSNAEIYNILHSPPGLEFAVDKKKNWSGSYGGSCYGGGPGGFNLDFFYDDFVIINKKPGVKLDKVKIKFSFTVEQDSVNNKGKEKYDGEVTYHFTNKDLNIRRCGGEVIW